MLRRVWWWLSRRGPIARTPLEIFDEAIIYVGFYFDYMEMELASPEKDDEEYYGWPDRQVESLEIAADLIGDVIAALRADVAAGSGR